jgi:hypothetical protein
MSTSGDGTEWRKPPEENEEEDRTEEHPDEGEWSRRRGPGKGRRKRIILQKISSKLTSKIMATFQPALKPCAIPLKSPTPHVFQLAFLSLNYMQIPFSCPSII